MRIFAILLGLCAVLPLAANDSGLPVGRTGGFGEGSCSGAGCHSAQPLSLGEVGVRIDVGPYVPGSTQRVRVLLENPAAQRWGFQLTARRADDNSLPAGTFEAVNGFVAVRCPDGTFAPCAPGEPQYVGQTSLGADLGGGGGAGQQAFFFNWIAPSEDVGEVIFAASGLAANGDEGTASDASATTIVSSLFAPTNSPSIGGVAGAAAPQRDPRRLAPKQLASLFGSNLNAPGVAVEVGVADFDVRGNVPDELSRMSVVFRFPGVANERPGRILFVNDTQVNFETPEFPPGADTAQVQAVINRGEGNSEIRSAAVTVNLAALAPGLFTFGGGGRPWPFGEGPAAAVNGVTGQIIAPAEAAFPGAVLARPGDVILLFGTGFGATTPDFGPGELADLDPANLPLIDVNITVELDGVALPPEAVLYAGAAPDLLGMEQFNIRLPDNLAPGRYALTIRAGNTVTQAEVFIEIRS